MRDKRFENKVVVVTGGSRNIGKAIAEEFVNEDAKVFVIYNKTEFPSESLHLVQADITDSKQVKEAFREIGDVDILINCAGYFEDKMSWKMKDETWDKTMKINLYGTFYCTREVIPKMREKGWGRIINISSVQGQVGAVGASNYCAAKSGIIGFTKSVALEVVNKGITVNTIAFGFFNSGMFLRLNNELQKKIIDSIPMKKAGDVEDAVNSVLFLSSNDAKYITGQTINVNGGNYRG